ncbi:MAG: CDP-alcohol phosphatidyltransferase family protein [Ruminococcus sp.]|nr:CDP-alcohol phosphatidyltransferase family protein [Ruminococcus sp.]MBR6384664.1 CDP-alcohol phosphatidyltransferase family protein [Ruminococcus sp.]
MSNQNQTEETAAQQKQPVKIIPSKLERKFADFTYKFVDLIPTSVQPNTVTAIGIICGMLGSLCFFLGSFSRIFFVFAILGLLTHIVCDNIDGYMARTRNQKSLRGGFFDIMSDTLVCTFTILFIGLSSYSHLELAAFGAPLYGIHMIGTLHYIMIYNEFPFPPFGPFEIHMLYISVALVNMIFGPVVLFTLFSVPVYLIDIVMVIVILGSFWEVGKSAFKLFFRLKKEGR